jgi:hypothetical protein
MREPELFETYYEINKPHTSPMLWKVVGATLAIHFVAFITLSQVNLLQTKACDSPYIGKVCEVLDAAYIGSVFLGTDRTSVNEPYKKTELEDADITFVDVSNMEPFKYPEGYFEPEIVENDLAVVDPNGNPIANSASPNGIPGFPGIPATVNPTMPAQNFPNVNSLGNKKGSLGGNSFGKNQKLPPPAKKVISSDDLDGFEIVGKNSTDDKNNKKDRKVISPTPTPKSEILSNKSPGLPDLGGSKTPKSDKTPKPQTSDAVADVKINKTPLTDMAGNLFAKMSANEVDLRQSFTVQMNGTLTADGLFDDSPDPKTKKPKSIFVISDGNEKTVEAVKEAIEALGDSGWLGYLRNLGVEKVSFKLIQDDENLRAEIVSDQPDEEKAKKISNGFNLLLKLALLKKLGADEKLLLESAKVTPNGKSFVLNVILPKDVVQALIEQKKKEHEAKAKATTTPQSNSVANGKNLNANIVK